MKWYYVPEMDRIYHHPFRLVNDFGLEIVLGNNWPIQRAMATHFTKQDH